jgi:flagella basal body P-ring formation protein FlgA
MHSILLRAGARVLLVMDGERLHIEVPVICLENGEAGRTIRVSGLDHRQTYVATVVDAKLLKGTL